MQRRCCLWNVCVWFYFWKGGWMSDERKKGRNKRMGGMRTNISARVCVCVRVCVRVCVSVCVFVQAPSTTLIIFEKTENYSIIIGQGSTTSGYSRVLQRFPLPKKSISRKHVSNIENSHRFGISRRRLKTPLLPHLSQALSVINYPGR